MQGARLVALVPRSPRLASVLTSVVWCPGIRIPSEASLMSDDACERFWRIGEQPSA